LENQNNPPLADTANLVERLLRIRDRIFKLAAVYAVSLSWDVAREGDSYRILFRELLEKLRAQDAQAADNLVQGFEALLLSDPIPKPTVPAAVQVAYEMGQEIRELQRRQPRQPEPKPGYIPDGLN
jgi:hypothetical protein